MFSTADPGQGDCQGDSCLLCWLLLMTEHFSPPDRSPGGNNPPPEEALRVAEVWAGRRRTKDGVLCTSRHSAYTPGCDAHYSLQVAILSPALKSPTPPHFPDGLNPHLIEKTGAFRRKLLHLPSTTIWNLTESVPIFSLFPPYGGGRELRMTKGSPSFGLQKPSPLALPRTWLLCSLLLLSLFPPSSVTHSHRHNNML